MKTMMVFGVLLAPLSLISQDSEGIEEVIVSATKTESNVQDLPIVVDVLTATQIEDMNITTARDIDSALPTLKMSPSLVLIFLPLYFVISLLTTPSSAFSPAK